MQNLAGFMFLALNHAFLDLKRRQGREIKVIDPDSDPSGDQAQACAGLGPTPEQQLSSRQQLAELECAFAALKPDQQRLFQLKFEQDLSYAQIAARLGINEALARKRVELLRKALRRQLDPDFTPPTTAVRVSSSAGGFPPPTPDTTPPPPTTRTKPHETLSAHDSAPAGRWLRLRLSRPQAAPPPARKGLPAAAPSRPISAGAGWTGWNACRGWHCPPPARSA
ncbi:RNA polymerase sigma factor [Chromobacterium violaceum]|uniref:RNA polymerase sigma factor n=1 Tax=Chromobacterium violaceum TaxID=536 RepID=A0A3S4ICQ5_CHRVL|nr:RNA polymerase sigma factor [Chromobacterium violaceum]